MAYSSSRLQFALVIALLCGESCGFWPFSVHAAAADVNTKRIAVIGAGAAGSSTAYYLQQFAAQEGVPINITVFERSSYIGGRSTTVNVYGNPLEPVELGASIFVEVNTILKNSSEAFGLEPKESSETDGDELLGIWNGKEFVFKQKDSGWYYWDIAKLLWKYGLAPVRVQRLAKGTVAKFLKLYEYPFFPFRSLSDRALDLGLTDITSLTGEQYLGANKIGPPFTTDIIQASTRVNYGQNLNLIHGLEAMVCMSIDGAMQIEGGNWQIFAGMLNASNATIFLNTTVTSISKSKSKYSIETTAKSLMSESSTNEEKFDTIILAAPLQFSNLKVAPGVLKHTPDSIPYVTLHVTLFTSPHGLDATYFNLGPKDEVPTSILTTLPVDEIPTKPEESVGSPGFFSISTLRTVINPETLQKEHLYKIFSPKPVTSDFLSGILGVEVPKSLSPSSSGPLTWIHTKTWFSYPYLFPRVTFEDPELARGFYYTSGIESFISTMETSALMGMNVARLIVDDYLNIVAEGDGEAGQKLVKEEL